MIQTDLHPSLITVAKTRDKAKLVAALYIAIDEWSADSLAHECTDDTPRWCKASWQLEAYRLNVVGTLHCALSLRLDKNVSPDRHLDPALALFAQARKLYPKLHRATSNIWWVYDEKFDQARKQKQPEKNLQQLLNAGRDELKSLLKVTGPKLLRSTILNNWAYMHLKWAEWLMDTGAYEDAEAKLNVARAAIEKDRAAGTPRAVVYATSAEEHCLRIRLCLRHRRRSPGKCFPKTLSGKTAQERLTVVLNEIRMAADRDDSTYRRASTADELVELYSALSNVELLNIKGWKRKLYDAARRGRRCKLNAQRCDPLTGARNLCEQSKGRTKWVEKRCPKGHTCQGKGVCTKQMCRPSKLKCETETRRVKCSDSGTKWLSHPCAQELTCIQNGEKVGCYCIRKKMRCGTRKLFGRIVVSRELCRTTLYGSRWISAPCPQDHRCTFGGSCVCLPGVARCGSTGRERCVGRTFRPSPCVAGFTCVGKGVCACPVNTFRCHGGQRQRCLGTSWKTERCQSAHRCEGKGDCICIRGSMRCRNNAREKCVDGKWTALPCASHDACTGNGQCTCRANQTRCGSAGRLKCIGKRWRPAQCAAGLRCTGSGRCACPLNRTRCGARGQLLRCTGTAWIVERICPRGRCVNNRCADTPAQMIPP